ncbi:hypothetical protein ACFX13_025760 [Malus domestica]
MERSDVENLVVHLEHSLDLSTMESGVKLVGAALTRKSLNKWGVRNILRSAWKDLGVLEIKWVHDNTYIITAQDEITALKILNQVPWAVMKLNFYVKRWSPDLAIEDIQMALVPFWIQIWGVPLSLSTELNVRRLAKEIGEFVEMEDPAKARGFLRVKVVVDSEKPLIPGCWIPRDNNRDTWIEFRYERLQDFCYRCGRIGHANTKCSGLPGQGNVATYGEWTRTAPIRDEVKVQHPLSLNVGEMRVAGATRGGLGTNSQRRVRAIEGMETGRSMGGLWGPHQQDEAHNLRSGSRKWQRIRNRSDNQGCLDTQAVRIHEIDDEGVQISASLGVESNPGQLVSLYTHYQPRMIVNVDLSQTESPFFGAW